VSTFVILGILNWRYICFLLFFWYFGHSLSYLNGHYRHYGGNPDKPIAWGVSSYNKLYNWTWFYNGYHAEHHFRPKVHWTRMEAFRDQILEQQRVASVRVIGPPHALGFLDPGLAQLVVSVRARSNRNRKLIRPKRRQSWGERDCRAETSATPTYPEDFSVKNADLGRCNYRRTASIGIACRRNRRPGADLLLFYRHCCRRRRYRFFAFAL
jgi:hypothetical protein